MVSKDVEAADSQYCSCKKPNPQSQNDKTLLNSELKKVFGIFPLVFRQFLTL